MFFCIYDVIKHKADLFSKNTSSFPIVTIVYRTCTCVSESETTLEHTSSQLKDEKQLRKNYENQLGTLREELAEVKLSNQTLDKVGGASRGTFKKHLESHLLLEFNHGVSSFLPSLEQSH